jgi:hypothetical protein
MYRQDHHGAKTMKKERQPKQHKGRLVAATVSSLAALAVVGAGIWQQVQSSMVTAKESFQGIGQIVEEHEDDPFVILDIVPGKGSVTLTNLVDYSNNNATVEKTYDVSLGTIGYLNVGQSPAEQDLYRIFTSSTDKALFSSYQNRKKLADAVVPAGYETTDNGFRIAYEEAYSGLSDISSGAGWMKIYDAEDGAAGRFQGYVESVASGEGDFVEVNSDGSQKHEFHRLR